MWNMNQLTHTNQSIHNTKHRSFMAPLLVWAQSSYKDIRKNMLILSHTHTHTHTHKHLISINMQSINQYIHIKQNQIKWSSQSNQHGSLAHLFNTRCQYTTYQSFLLSLFQLDQDRRDSVHLEAEKARSELALSLFFLWRVPCGVPNSGVPCGVPNTGVPCGVPNIGVPCGVPNFGVPCGVPNIGSQLTASFLQPLP